MEQISNGIRPVAGPGRLVQITVLFLLSDPGEIFFQNELGEAAYSSDPFIFIPVLNFPAQRKLLHFVPQAVDWNSLGRSCQASPSWERLVETLPHSKSV